MNNSTIFVFLIGSIMSYLLGSICSAVLVSKIFNLPDPRLSGSNNPGATNVLRLSGKKYAIIVLLADVLKGFLPVAIANLCHVNHLTLSFIGLAAVIGHIYPIFFKFQGGKGVATALGVLFGINIILGLLACITWIVVAFLSKYSSLSSITTILLAPFYALILIGNTNIFPGIFCISIIIIYKHQKNIRRLIDGQEDTINWSKK